MKVLELKHIIKEEVNNTLNPFKKALSGGNIIIHFFRIEDGREYNIEITNLKKSRGLSCGEDADIDLFKRV